MPSGLAQPAEQCPSSVPKLGWGGKCLPSGIREQGTAMVSPRAWMVADGAEQRDRGGRAGQPGQGAVLPSSAFCSWPSWSWLTRGCFIAGEPSGRGSLPGNGCGFLQRRARGASPACLLNACGLPELQGPRAGVWVLKRLCLCWYQRGGINGMTGSCCRCLPQAA